MLTHCGCAQDALFRLLTRSLQLLRSRHVPKPTVGRFVTEFLKSVGQIFLAVTCAASIDQYTCITAKMNAALTPNRSIPSTASKAPIICHGRCSVSPDAPRVLIESRENSKASMGESRAPSHKYAAAQIPDSIPCNAAKSSPITAVRQIRITIRFHKLTSRVSSRTRILTPAKAIITTAAAWIAMVKAMSDKPQIQLVWANNAIEEGPR